jgi:hypothetical protein
MVWIDHDPRSFTVKVWRKRNTSPSSAGVVEERVVLHPPRAGDGIWPLDCNARDLLLGKQSTQFLPTEGHQRVIPSFSQRGF